jgi:hypothetical protein
MPPFSTDERERDLERYRLISSTDGLTGKNGGEEIKFRCLGGNLEDVAAVVGASPEGRAVKIAQAVKRE